MKNYNIKIIILFFNDKKNIQHIKENINALKRWNSKIFLISKTKNLAQLFLKLYDILIFIIIWYN